MTTQTSTAENPTAGQGPVLLDIGGDVGALVVSMPAHTRGLEVEIRPRGATVADAHAAHRRHHSHDHGHDHGHDHPHGDHDHDLAPSRYPHVGVVERTTAEGPSFSLVYPGVVAGEYELCPLPDGEVAATASVVGGEVTQLEWPG